MKTTILVFHPEFNNSVVNQALVKAVENHLDDIEIRHLYELYPDGKIDVKKEQKVIEKSDRIIFQFPLYWYSSPSLLKEWQDKVLTYGWAYGSQGNALKGKELLLAVTAGASLSDYQADGRQGYTLGELLRPFQAMANMTGMIYLEPFTVFGTLSLSKDKLENACQDYRHLLEIKY